MSTGQLSLMNITHSWTIENFTSYCEKEDPVVDIISPIVLVNSKISIFLELQICNVPKNQEPKYISLFCRLTREFEEKIIVQYQFFLPDYKNQSKDFKKIGSPLMYSSENSSYQYGRRCLLKKLVMDPKYKQVLLPDDKFTVLCKMEITNKYSCVSIKNCSEGTEKLFENQDFSDTILIVDGKELKVHKAILAAKSPVFYAMFCHNTKEANENLVKIDDFSFDVMKDVVQFIYTGNIKNFENRAKEILAAADKYGINDLILFCCTHFQEKLNIENAVELLILCNGNLSYPLLHYVEFFIIKNLNTVLKTEGFKQAKKTHSLLLIDIVCKALEKTT